MGIRLDNLVAFALFHAITLCAVNEDDDGGGVA